jgi:hypothetical protein
LGAGGEDIPRFERKTPARLEAIQQHTTIVFRQRFLALPGEIRNQIYDEVIAGHQERQSQHSLYHLQTGRFMYTEHHSDQSSNTLFLSSDQQQPDHLHYIREGDHMWQELMDRWLIEVDCQSSQAFDLGVDGFPEESRESTNSLYPVSPRNSSLHIAAISRACSLRGLNIIAHRWIRTFQLTLNFYGIDFDFSQTAQDPYTSPLYTTVSQIARYLTAILKTSDVRIKINLWPGEYMEHGDHGWEPFFASEADVEGLWALLRPLKSIPGIQSIRAKRLRGSALWSRQPNSLYPENPPLVIVERADDGWLDWDRGWSRNWGFGDFVCS